ncbi:MAG: glycosyltransferase family 2 protein [Anaerolineales bacterium]|nr:MAG: glycosyltransferase family 2 protein [Anaerolineales bacterium]
MIEQEPYLSIVIPVYNEEESLHPLSDELEAALQTLQQPYEIIFVDDGSTDDSFAVLQQLHEADPDHVRVVSFRRNFGKTAALSVGFKRALGEVVVTMDADLQDDPHEMPKLLNKLDEGWDLVAAWRERRQDPVSKTLPSRVANAVVARFTGLELHDFNCGFKAHRAQVVRELKLYGDLHRYIPVLASWQGFRVAEVPVLHRPRRFGRSKYGWQRMVRGFFDFLVVLFLTHYLRRPLQLFGIAGAVCLLIGFIIGLYLTYLRLFGPGIGWRPALFFDVMAIVVGVQLISIGLLGEMLRNFSYRSEDEYSIRTEL